MAKRSRGFLSYNDTHPFSGIQIHRHEVLLPFIPQGGEGHELFSAVSRHTVISHVHLGVLFQRVYAVRTGEEVWQGEYSCPDNPFRNYALQKETFRSLRINICRHIPGHTWFAFPKLLTLRNTTFPGSSECRYTGDTLLSNLFFLMIHIIMAKQGYFGFKEKKLI